MINFSISIPYTQILIFIISITIFFVAFNLVKALITSSQWYVGWYVNRKSKLQNKVKKTQQQIIYEKFMVLKDFVTLIDAHLGNNKNRKNFWKDFALSPSTRKFWVEKITNDMKPKEEESKQVKVKIIGKEENPEKSKLDPNNPPTGGSGLRNDI